MARSQGSAKGRARGAAGSFDRLAFDERSQRVEVVPPSETKEAFLRRGAVRKIGLEHTFDDPRRVFGFDVVVDLRRDRRVRTEAAADVNVVTFDSVALLGRLHLAGEQSDVADVVLRAGVMTAGEMNVHGPVERDAAFAPAGDLLGMSFGIGRREFAPGISGARDEPGANGVHVGRETETFDLCLRRHDLLRRHSGDDQVLPNGEADVAVAEVPGYFGEPAHLSGGPLADRKPNPPPIAVGLLLRMHADMRDAIEWRTRLERIAGDAVELAAGLFLGQRQDLLKAQAVKDVFQPRLVAVGAVALVDEDPHDGIGHFCRVGRLDHDAGFARKVPVAGDAADHEAEPNAGRNCESVLYLDRLEADVVGVLQHGNEAGTVEADVELAWQAVERALVENVEMPFARKRAGVDQFLPIDAGSGR